MKRFVGILLVVCMTGLPVCAQSANKLRVVTAPGVTKVDQKDWKNTLTITGPDMVLDCRKCSPIQTVTVPVTSIAALHYGQNAYHHWAAGIATGVLSLGVGLIVGLMPHHQHFYSIDEKDGKVLGIQADKGNYRDIARMLQQATHLPIEVTSKDAHFLAGFNTKIVDSGAK
ncbi:MAG TPA: hypothetical protein VMV57_11205 [Terracidiphilus sp.]|nr:hypothetical protein [Terracidiphilus sp.]